MPHEARDRPDAADLLAVPATLAFFGGIGVLIGAVLSQ